MYEYLFTDLTHQIIGLSIELHKALGPGFLENIYENGLMNELDEAGIKAISQVPLEVVHKGKILGTYRADIIVDDKVIIELKAANAINEKHVAQLVGYLKTTGYKVGLLINFGAESLEIKRKVNYDQLPKLDF